MKFNILYEKDAEQDLIKIVTYITKELNNPTAAKKLHLKIIETLDNIANFPTSASLSKYINLQTYGIRQITVDNFSIFYYPDMENKNILVLFIKYAQMDLSKLKL